MKNEFYHIFEFNANVELYDSFWQLTPRKQSALLKKIREERKVKLEDIANLNCIKQDAREWGNNLVLQEYVEPVVPCYKINNNGITPPAYSFSKLQEGVLEQIEPEKLKYIPSALWQSYDSIKFPEGVAFHKAFEPLNIRASLSYKPHFKYILFKNEGVVTQDFVDGFLKACLDGEKEYKEYEIYVSSFKKD